MLVVCHATFSWSSLRLAGKIPRVDAAVVALVSATVVARDLAVAVLAGTVLSALSFSWQMSTRVAAPRAGGGGGGGGEVVYAVEGNVFFGSAHHFRQLFDGEAARGGQGAGGSGGEAGALPKVVLDFGRAFVLDQSGAQAVGDLARRLALAGSSQGQGQGRGRGREVVLRHLPRDVAAFLAEDLAAVPGVAVEADAAADPVYAAAVDRPPAPAAQVHSMPAAGAGAGAGGGSNGRSYTPW